MTKIFISHSKHDTEFSLRLAQALVDQGVEVWIDKSDIHASEKWNDAIQRGLKECEMMIVVITPESMASKNVGDEWLYYHRRGKRIFTVLLKPTDDIHFQLEPIQYIDFHQQDFSDAFAQLNTELKRNGVIFETVKQNHGITLTGSLVAIKIPGRIEKPEVSSISDILPPPFEWCEISAGKVLIEDATNRAGTKGEVFYLPDFFISKYPITNAQYDVFIEHPNGYVNRKWWTYSRAAENWRGRNPQSRETKIRFSGKNLPRTYITWYEAVAYCHWLSEISDSKFSIMLPTEQQWQRAALGDTQWLYPWGDEFDSSKCNTKESSIGHPMSVTQYPEGASPFGVIDMSGNVWEWCLTGWGKEILSSELSGEIQRCIRGGMWNADQTFARASYRDNESPRIQDGFVGFRICYSTGK